MINYANTSLYQPVQNNYNNFGSGYNTGFSLSNYTDMSSSIFQGQSINIGGYSPMAPQQPQQNNNSDAFLQQLVLLLLSAALQKRNQPETTTKTEQTIITDEGDDVRIPQGHDAPRRKGPSTIEKALVAPIEVAKKAAELPIKVAEKATDIAIKAAQPWDWGW